MGNRKVMGLWIALVLSSLFVAACGSGSQTSTTQPPPLSAATAAHLAKLSETVATDLDNGDTCHAAHAADDLNRAVQDADLSASLRPGVEEVAGRLVDEVNCPPPPPPPAPEKKPKHEAHKPNQHGDAQKPPGHGGKLPPGQAKLKGEEG